MARHRSTSDDTFHDLRRLHRWFAVSAIALLAATAWMLVADQRREWKSYERGDGDAGVRQIWLPDLSINYNFCQVARFDRCTTCHREADQPGPGVPTPGGRPPLPLGPHPRPDLFCGPESPHPAAEFGCTICHDGQGSATEFRFASHSPDDPAQQAQWRAERGWFRDLDWDFPMRPRRFAESNCLKCHHDLVDLEPSRRFPDPPAPKLLAGYQLVRQYGCFGCHEISGAGPSGERIGPDMRPGSEAMPKVGPSLRRIAGKLDAATLEAWIAQPAAVRPSTRMPQLFGMYDHLDGKGLDDARRLEPVEVRAIAAYLLAASQPGKEKGDRHHLCEAPFGPFRQMVPVPFFPSAATESPSAERGKRLFLLNGCLACHTHGDFPEGQATQGPDLSQLATKLATPLARAWLVSWLRDPARHSPATLMPNPLLTSAEGRTVGQATAQSHQEPPSPQPSPKGRGDGDPAEDITAYLLSGPAGKPGQQPPLCEPDLDALALLYLEQTLPAATARQVLRDGAAASTPAADAGELAAPVTVEKKLHYVGRQTIRKRGCFGCHDIAGFEAARPIGPALSDWGRKPESLLAFEQVESFLESAPPAVDSVGGRWHVVGGESEPHMPPTTYHLPSSTLPSPLPSPNGRGDTEAAADPFYLAAVRTRRREGFLWQKLRDPRSFDYGQTDAKGYNEHLLMGRFAFSPAQREAIMTFVLGLVAESPGPKYLPPPEPRRRAIIEGRKVLDKYACAQCHVLEMEQWVVDFDVPSPVSGRGAGGEGSDSVDRRVGQATAQSHQEPPQTDSVGGRWHVAGGESQTHIPPTTYHLPSPTLPSPQPSPKGRGDLVGMPQRTAEGKLDETEDEDGNPLYAFQLWEPATIGSKTWPVGGAAVLVPPGKILQKRPPRGGDFARLLFPAAIAEAKQAGSTAGPQEAWGFLPPALVHVGRAVQPGWLHDYLLQPSVIRPASLLRMPKYNLSPAEARKLADYFAAAAGAEFPFDSDPRGIAARQAAGASSRFESWQRAYRLVTDEKAFCGQCHLFGDRRPGGGTPSAGSWTTLAPNLQRVAARIRPEYLRRWLADPKAILPYTPMPVNFPPNERRGQDLLPGTSGEQLDAVVDFLLNYGEYARGKGK